MLLAIILELYEISTRRGATESVSRALTFAAMVVTDLGLIVANRSRLHNIIAMLAVPNRSLWWILAGGVAILAAVLYLPLLQNLFSFGVLHPADIGVAIGAGVVAILGVEATKHTGFLRPKGSHAVSSGQ